MAREKTVNPTQQDGEDRDSVIGAVFALILEKKSKEFPDLKTFLETIGMSVGTYYNLVKGVGNPTFWTVERAAKALGLSAWDMIGVDEKVMRAWLAGQNIDIDKVAQRVESRRLARQAFSLEQFGLEQQAATPPSSTPPAPTAAMKRPAIKKAAAKKVAPKKRATTKRKS
jgi:hypothetical protein